MLVHCVWQNKSWQGALPVSSLMLPSLGTSFLAPDMWHDSQLHATSDSTRPLRDRMGIF